MTVDRILLSVDEVAQALSLGRSKVYEELNAGRIKSVTIGRARRIHRAEVDAYVERLKPGATEPGE